MGEYNFSFEKLDVWQKSREFVVLIYEITSKYPSNEIYGLVSQMRRAVVSITSNISEGSSRSSIKEQIRFTEIAYGSALEVYCQLVSSKDLNFITEDAFDQIVLRLKEITNKLNALRNSQLKRLE